MQTNRPDFDRLVNIWLPYQTMASRLFGRVGPNQRGGAFGFRDQLQDVLPLIFIAPRLARKQIFLHAGQQFLEGDVLKWWHRAPDGRTGLGQRTKASDPHLWLPYVLSRYVAATGDFGLLDETVAYLEGPAVPAGEDTFVLAPRASRERGDVYEHCRRAIDYTLRHRGTNGLPLLGAGDWNDGIDALGREGRGTSVWMGFFFFDVLDPLRRSSPRAKGDSDFATALRGRTRRRCAKSLDVGWQGTHYALDFADDGAPLAMPNAMTTGWPAYSGAVDHARGVAAMEGGLAGVERREPDPADPDPVLRAFLALSRPHRRLSARRARERRAIQPWRVLDRRRPGAALGRGARRRRRGGRGAARRARLRDLREDLAAEEDRSRQHRALRAFDPNQQPADIYDGYGHDGRGGWSWYTGSAARMLSAAYALVGLSMVDGEVAVAPDWSEPKGELRVAALRAGGRDWRRDGAAAARGLDAADETAETPAE